MFPLIIVPVLSDVVNVFEISRGVNLKWTVFFFFNFATIAFSERYEGRTSRKHLF